MKIKKPENENYSATIVKINSVHKLEGLDNLVGISFFGLQALVNKDTETGTLGVLLPAETQLSLEMAKENNLHRHGDLNKDESVSGYLEDNRRVRAIKLRGNSSSALFLSLNSLKWTGADISKLSEGDTFDELNGKEICKKYVKRQKITSLVNSEVRKEKARIDKKFFPEHIDTDNYWRNKKKIKGNDAIVITQKLHGTSIRIGNAQVNRKLNFFENALRILGVKVQETEYDVIAGSRKVIKDIKNPFQNHFYSEDLWTAEGKKLEGSIPHGFMVYAELIGYTSDGAQIQKDYTYNEAVGNRSLYVYRVSFINDQAIEVDLSWDALKIFCSEFGLKYTPELWRGKHRNIDVDSLMNLRYSDTFKNAIPLSDPGTVDEGVVIRKEGLKPTLLKAKSSIFLEHETKMLDQEVVDIEEEQKL